MLDFLFAAFFAAGFAFAAGTLGALAAALPAAGATVLAALRAKHRTVWRNITGIVFGEREWRAFLSVERNEEDLLLAIQDKWQGGSVYKK